MKKVILFVSILAFFGNQALSQLNVTQGQTINQYIQSLVGANVVVSNITFTGDSTQQIGAFTTGGGSAINLSSGIILSTGDVGDAMGSETNFSSTDVTPGAGPSDPDLLAISSVTSINDAVVIEFDIYPYCDTVSIFYSFASEEYANYTCSNFNDAFGFFISGPGIMGPYSNSAINISTVPGTNTPVSINTVNSGVATGGNPSACSSIDPNWQSYNIYFNNNIGATNDHVYSGNTVKMEAKVSVTPCTTYHIKLALGDGGDGSFDSAVFLETGGVTCTGNLVSIAPQSSTSNTSTDVIEACNVGQLVVNRIGGDTTQALTIYYTLSGSATYGTDYTVSSPDSIVFAPFQMVDTVFVYPVADGIPETQETVLFTVADSACGGVIYTYATFFIEDDHNFHYDNDTIFCSGSSNIIGFTPQTGYSYTWSSANGISDSTVGNPIFSMTNTTGSIITQTYIVEIQDDDQCIGYDTVNISVLPAAVASFTYNNVCIGSPMQFTDNTSTSVGNIVSWSWDFGNGNVSTLQNPSYLYGSVGAYPVTLVITTDSGCTASFTDTVNVVELPVANFSADSVCLGITTTFTDNSTFNSLGNITQRSWYFGDGDSLIGNSLNPTHTYDTSGTFTTQLIIDYSIGCSDTFTKQIVVHPLPVVDFVAIDSVCDGVAVAFFDSSTVESGNIVAWSWDFGNSASSTLQNPTHIFPNSGLHIVTLTCTSDNGCVSDFSKTVYVEPNPNFILIKGDSSCKGNSLLLQVNATNTANYSWYYDDSSPWVIGSGKNFNTPILFGSHTYYVEGTSPNGCVSGRIPVLAYIYPHPVGSIVATSNLLEMPDAIDTFSVSGANTGAIASYLWDFGDGSTSTESNPIHQYNETGNYTVTLTIIDTNGCQFVTVYPEKIKVKELLYFAIPNAFSPNGDGINDKFFIGSKLIEELSIQIYSRWGQKIFESNKLDFVWDGTFEGKQVPEGAYIFYIKARTYNNRDVEEKGSITILK